MTEDYSEILKEGERILLQMSDSDDHTCEGWNGIGDENFGKAYIDIKDIFEHPEIKAKLKTIEERVREEIKKQLELTLLMHEKEENESPTVEPLESKIRAFIRHFLDTLNTKK